ncbi:MAG: class I SAM-dependent methyltransferase [Mariprofundaceae bacterium]|nr:class I SAM-dependent methyltransferase [Mariprofundaceae bacterium]
MYKVTIKIKFLIKLIYRKTIFYADHLYQKLFDIILQKDFSEEVTSCNYKQSKLYEVKTIFKTLNTNHKVFLDVGSGKGAVLFLAKKFDFIKIYGVEIDDCLHSISVSNFKDKKDNRIKLINSDIFKINKKTLDSVNIFYLFNPFPYNETARFVSLVTKSYQRNKREIQIIYTCSKYNFLFTQENIFKEMKEIHFFVSNSPTIIFTNQSGQSYD